MEIPISTADLVLGDCGSADLEPKFHYMDPYGLCLRPDPTRPDQTRPDPRTTSVHVDTERTSRQPDGGLVEDPSGPLVWSSRVRLMEYGHYLTEAYLTRLDVGDTALIRIWVGRTNEARLHHNR